MTTVKEVLKLGMPKGGRVVAGGTGLEKEVTWVTVLRGSPLLPDDVDTGDLILLAPIPVALSSERLVAMIREVARLGAVGIGVIGTPPPSAIAVADELNFPLLALPPGTRLVETKKSAVAIIFNRQLELEKRGVQIYRDLAQMVTGNRGIGAIIDALAEMIGKVVTLQDQYFRLTFYAGQLYDGLTAETLREALHDNREIEDWISNATLTSPNPPVGQFDLPHSHLSRLVAPVVVRDSVSAYLSILAPKTELTELDTVAIGRATTVSAIELAKERAVVEAENQVRGEFLEDLLTGNFLTEEAVIRRGTRLGYDLAAHYLVAVYRTDLNMQPGKPIDRTITDIRTRLVKELKAELPRRAPAALWHFDRDSAIVLWPVFNGDVAAAKTAVDDFREFLEKMTGNSTSAGLGRISDGVLEIPRAYREASQALGVAQNLLGGNRTAFIDDLLIYRLLFPLQGSRELLSFYEETIGRIADHDQRRGSELVKTLTAFFDSHGNVNQTAEKIFLHRNAVSYRLKRIEEISGLSLEDPEHRLALQLGLKAKDII